MSFAGGLAIAGAIGGLGDSIVQKAKQRREDFLLAQKMAYDREMADLAFSRQKEMATMQNEFAMGRQNAQNDFTLQRDAAGRAADADRARRIGGGLLSAFDTTNVSPSAINAFGALEKDWGEPFKVNSAYRDPQHNEAVGGASKSQHMHGNAFDVDVSQYSIEQRQDLIRRARAAGFTGIGVYNNSLHFDVGGDRAWGPDYHRGSLPDWAKDAVGAPVGNGAGQSRPYDAQVVGEIMLSDLPSSVREGFARQIGITDDTARLKVDNLQWVNQGDGTEALLGQVNDTEAMIPMEGLDGAPIARPVTAKPITLSSGLQSKIERALRDPLTKDPADPLMVVSFMEQVKKLMTENGMSEDDAYNQTFRLAEREPETRQVPGTGIFGFGRDTVTEETGPFTGTFKQYQPAAPAAAPAGNMGGLGGTAAPAEAPPKPSRPASGPPAVQSRDQLDQLIRQGVLDANSPFKAPDGSTAYVQPQDVIRARNSGG